MKKMIGVLLAILLGVCSPAYCASPGQRISKTLSTVGQVAPVSASNCSGVTFQLVDGGNWSGTVTWQASLDGENWVSVKAINVNSQAIATTATAAGIYTIPASGLATVRANATTVMAGSIIATGNCAQGLNAGLLTGTGLALDATLGDLSTEATLATASTTLTSLNGKVTAVNTGATKDAAATSATLSNVSSSASNVQLLASTAGRRGAVFFNDSSAILYLKLGATATTTSYTVQLAAGASYTLPVPTYTGQIDGIWASANGAVRITEFQ